MLGSRIQCLKNKFQLFIYSVIQQVFTEHLQADLPTVWKTRSGHYGSEWLPHRRILGQEQLPGKHSSVHLGECLGQQALEWACLSLSRLFHFPSCVALGRAVYLSEGVYSSKTWVILVSTQESHCENLSSTVKTQSHGLRKCFKNISFYSVMEGVEKSVIKLY